MICLIIKEIWIRYSHSIILIFLQNLYAKILVSQELCRRVWPSLGMKRLQNQTRNSTLEDYNGVQGLTTNILDSFVKRHSIFAEFS